MTNDWRVVIDTNVAVSAALFRRSLPRQAVELALRRCKLLVSAASVFELEEVLRRPKFNKYLTETERLEFLAALVREAEVVEIREAIKACRDPKDDKFLDLAVSGQATHVIRGDSDLLRLDPFRGIAILTPQAFTESAK